MNFPLLFEHHHRHHHVFLFVGNVGVQLHPEERAHLMVDVTVGHKLNLSIGYLDANGNPMLSTPTPDAAPAWSNTTPATETLAAAPDGLTCVGTVIAVGTDVVTVSLAVGGAAFTATLSVTADAAPQVLTSIVINAAVQ